MLVTHRGLAQEYEDTETGTRYFSVSQIRRVAHDPFAGLPKDYLDAARERGTLVHRFLWQHLFARAGLIDFPPLIPTLEGYCTSIVDWAAARQIKAVQLEAKGVNREEGYAGQVDGQVLYGPKEILTLMDGKTGDPTLTDPMQLLLYDAMEGFKSKQLLDIYFRPDGSAKEVFVDVRKKVTEWPWAMAALNVLRGRVNHGCG